MALGKPLVLSRVGGAEEQVIPGETGFLFSPGDIDALTVHLKTLSNTELTHRMGQTAARMVIFLVIAKVALQLVDVDGQQGNLNFRRTGVTFSRLVFLNNLRFLLGGHRHNNYLIYRYAE